MTRLVLTVCGLILAAATPRVASAGESPRSEQGRTRAMAPAHASSREKSQRGASSADARAADVDRTPSVASAPAGAAVDAWPLAGVNIPEPLMRSATTVLVFAAVSFAPAAALMVTAFVRIQIVLMLLRQALGSLAVPGNQVLTVLALLLTAMVMKPTTDVVYERAIAPYSAGKLDAARAWTAGSTPIKRFMIDQIARTNHESYLWRLHDELTPPTPGRPDPTYAEEMPLTIVAPAFMLSELSTAFMIGFYLYLPFLVIDLVVASVLAAMGLSMMPPTLVAMPLKLVLFVLADGWVLVASMLIRGFAIGSY
ncbi:MAG: EscR/YscR/HrcR family type III secretion system export apparatus protein [Planctomycetota bacterium]|nr:EscR/YscR/HrcR family type III secretion system export apparatus protein [Planctomycetota bacterium]